METQQTAIIGLVLLNGCLLLCARWFDRRIYIPFLLKMKVPVEQPQHNPHLLRLGLWAAGAGLVMYAMIAWWVWS